MKRHRLLLLLIAFLSALNVFSAPEVEKKEKPEWVIDVKDSEKKIPSKSIKEGYYYKLFDNQIHVQSEADYNHFIFDIASKVGVQQASNISVTFIPDYQKLIFHDITVWRAGKPINKLKLSEIKVLPTENELSSFLYHGTYYAHIILDDIRVGDRIEYSYTLKGRNPVFSGKYSESLFFNEFVPIAHLYKRLIVDKNRKLNFKNFGNIPKVKNSADNQYQYYEWESFSVPAVEAEERMPAWESVYSRVEISEYQTWEEVVNWAMALNPVKEVNSGTLGEKVKELKQIHRGYHKEGYIEDAIRLVQDDIRYMGVEIGVYSHKANSPEKVFSQRYGDCKDKSVLLASILKSGGINASLALVNSRTGSVLNESLISPLRFDHMIVYINHKGRSYFIDPTISYQRGGLYSLYCPKYYKALVLSAGQKKLTDIPQQPVELGKITVEESFFMYPRGEGVRLQVRSVYSGNHANDMRYRFAYSGEEGMEKEFLEYYRKLYNEVELSDSISVFDNEQNNTFEIIENYDLKDVWKPVDENGQRHAFYFSAALISENFAKVNPRRKYGLGLNYPYEIKYNINFHMWAPWSIKKEHFDIKRAAYEFSSNTFSKGNIISIEYNLKTFKDHISVSELAEYRKDIPEIEKHMGLELYYSGNGIPVLTNGFVVLCTVGFACFFLLACFLCYRLYIKPSGYVISIGEQSAYQNENLGWVWGLMAIVPVFAICELIVLVINYFSAISYLRVGQLNGQTFLPMLFHLFKPLINLCNVFLGVLLFLFLVNRRTETLKYANIWGVFNILSLGIYWIDKESSLEQVSSEFRILMFLGLAILIMCMYCLKTSETIDRIFKIPYPYADKKKSYKPLKRKIPKTAELEREEEVL